MTAPQTAEDTRAAVSRERESSDGDSGAARAAVSTPRRPIRHRLIEWGFVPLVLLTIVTGALVRATVKDSTLATAWLFYIAQPACLALGCLVLSLVWLRLRRRLASGIALAGAAGFAAAWFSASFGRANVTPAGGPVYRALCWNTSYGTFGREGILDAIRRGNADIIGLVERPKQPVRAEELNIPGGPAYQLIAASAGLQIFSRYAGRRIATNKLGRGGLYLHAEIDLDGRPVQVVLVDVTSSPRIPRSDALGRAASIAARRSGVPLLMLGDFNTPPDSVHFSPLRTHLMNAFEAAGAGYAPTWPTPAPVLQLDQAWVSPELTPIRCAAGWTLHSDHRPVTVEFQLRSD